MKLLPDELLISIFGWLEWDELLRLQSVCRKWREISVYPGLHRSLTFFALPPSPLPRIIPNTIMRSVRHILLHLFPYPTRSVGGVHPTSILITLLGSIPKDQLLSLSLPFSAPYLPAAELWCIMNNLGGKLQHLDLRGSGLSGGKWTEWVTEVGKYGDGLKSLDMGFTSINALPPTSNAAFPGQGEAEKEKVDVYRNLQSLSLASCTYLPPNVLRDFLADLPPTIERLDLSRLDNVTYEALWNMRVLYPLPTSYGVTKEEEGGRGGGGGGWGVSELKEIKVVGIDHLTRLDVRRLKAHWEEQRRAVLPPPPATSLWNEGTKPFQPVPIRWTPMTPPPSGPAGLPASPSRGLDRVKDVLDDSPPIPNHPFVGIGSLPTPPPSVSPPLFSSGYHRPQDGEEEREEDRVEIHIVHSAILESEDEAGYRQFIGEVVGGTVAPGTPGGAGGHGYGLGLGWGQASAGHRTLISAPPNSGGQGHVGQDDGLGAMTGWVEVDGGVL